MSIFYVGFISGYGLFAGTDIPVGAFVVEYYGNIITMADSKTLETEYGTIGSSYMMHVPAQDRW